MLALSPMRAPAPTMSLPSGAESLAKELNPAIGYFDPLGLATAVAIRGWGMQ